MTNKTQIFENKDFGQISVIDIEGQPWFAGKDVAAALGYALTSSMVKRLDCEDFIYSKMAHMNMKSVLIYKLLMFIMTAAIFILVYGRMVEIYCVVSIAPLPLSTMANKEWEQIGNNYLKSLFCPDSFSATLINSSAKKHKSVCGFIRSGFL